MFIYILYPKHNKNIKYVGSSSTSVSIKKSSHKAAVHTNNSRLYNFIRNNGGMDFFEMEVFEEFTGDEKDLKKREGEIIRDFKHNPEFCILNKRVEGQTKKEWYLQNREEKLAKFKEYYHNNKDKVKEYYLKNREKKLQ